MARKPTKARVEGDAVTIEGPIAGLVDATLEALPDPAPGDNGEALERLVDFYAKSNPDEWEGLRRCPLEAGLTHMIEAMKR